MGAPQTFALPAVIDLDAIDAIREALLDAIEAGPVEVTGAGVERVSTNGLILLLSAAETARRHGSAFAVADPSPAMTIAVERLGLASHFAEMAKG